MVNADFNKVAPYYSFLKKLVFGNQLLLAESHFLNSIKENSSVLIVGGGTGEQLPILDQLKPGRITFVESSEEMIHLARNRSVVNQVEFIHSTLQQSTLNTKFDAIVLPFVLDLYPENEVSLMLRKIRQILSLNGILILTDFQKPTKWSHKALLKLMYFFFAIASSLKTKKLPPIFNLVEREGLTSVQTKTFCNGFVRSSVYGHK